MEKHQNKEPPPDLQELPAPGAAERNLERLLESTALPDKEVLSAIRSAVKLHITPLEQQLEAITKPLDSLAQQIESAGRGYARTNYTPRWRSGPRVPPRPGACSTPEPLPWRHEALTAASP